MVNDVGIRSGLKKHPSRRGSMKNKIVYNQTSPDESEEKPASEGILGNVLKRQNMIKEQDERGVRSRCQFVSLPICIYSFF